MDTSPVKNFLLDLHSRIVNKLEALDGKPFLRDEWQRPARRGVDCRLRW